jgi:hypothetical protein
MVAATGGLAAAVERVFGNMLCYRTPMLPGEIRMRKRGVSIMLPSKQ